MEREREYGRENNVLLLSKEFARKTHSERFVHCQKRGCVCFVCWFFFLFVCVCVCVCVCVRARARPCESAGVCMYVRGCMFHVTVSCGSVAPQALNARTHTFLFS